MSDFQFLDIVIFAMVALFLVLRLRSVLGRRTGNERRRADPFSAPAPAPTRTETDNVIALPERKPDGGAEPGSVAQALSAIRAADPKFNEQEFLAGARAAFEMIIGAFAVGDRA